jgi:hypothetical protein
VGVVRRDPGERNGVGVVGRSVQTRIRDLDRVERQAGRADLVRTGDRLLHRELVARGMVQHVELFPVAHHLADVLIVVPVVQLDAVEEQQRRREMIQRLPVAHGNLVLVIGHREEVVAQPFVFGDQLRWRPDAIRERGMGVEVTAEKAHE